jgi:hypothetical protein
MPTGLRLQLALSLLALAVGVAGLSAPSAIRLPAEGLACLLAPWALYFRSFARLQLVVRAGVSLIAVIASWAAASTAVLALGTGVSNGAVTCILIAVYLLTSIAYLALRRGTATARDPLD